MTTQEPTSELVSKACSGNRQAFDTLVELYRLRLLRQIGSRLGTNLRAKLEPEDVFQDTLVRAYESIQRFRWQGEESFYSWLGSIAEHLIWSASQKKSSSQLELNRDLAHSDTSPSTNLRRHERFDRLEEAINRLAPEQKEALLLSRFEGLKIRDIAARMNRSPNAVYKLLTRAVLQLKKDFGDTESLHLPDRAFRAEEDRDDE